MEQAGPVLAVTDQGSVRRWTMQLAPVNAINAELLDAFEAALSDAEADPTVAAVVLDSGLKVFSASGTARAR
jgi:enoyl-CoA hydratase/carnithine racemase